MPLCRFYRGTSSQDAETRRVTAKLQGAVPASTPWQVDLEVVFYVQFDGGITLDALGADGAGFTLWVPACLAKPPFPSF